LAAWYSKVFCQGRGIDAFILDDEDFREHYLFCIGELLLLSAPHDEAIGSRPFTFKRAAYTSLRQQREILGMTADELWGGIGRELSRIFTGTDDCCMDFRLSVGY